MNATLILANVWLHFVSIYLYLTTLLTVLFHLPDFISGRAYFSESTKNNSDGLSNSFF